MTDVEYKKMRCFIVTPIGSDHTPERRAAEGVIDSVIVPALLEIGFDNNNILIPHRMPKPGSITSQVINEIIEADIVIVNLTGFNPNVMYELAIRHAARKPVITLCEKGTSLPFDINDQRTILYTNDMLGVKEVKGEFLKMLPAALNDKKPDNPIYRVINDNMLKNNTEAQIPAKVVFERFQGIEQSISSLSQSVNQLAATSNLGYNTFPNLNQFASVGVPVGGKGYGTLAFPETKVPDPDFETIKAVVNSISIENAKKK